MTKVQYSLNKFSDGFYITLFAENVTPSVYCDPVQISQYELSRNNIKGYAVKSVKTVYSSFQSNGGIIIASDVDAVEFPHNTRGVMPFIIGNGDITIRAVFDVDAYGRLNTPRIIFYNHHVGYGVTTY